MAEPWAEEFKVPIRSSFTMKLISEPRDHNLGDIEYSDVRLIFWANVGCKFEIAIDGAVQDSAAAITAVPDLPPGMSTKDFLNIVFGGQPVARLGGN